MYTICSNVFPKTVTISSRSELRFSVTNIIFIPPANCVLGGWRGGGLVYTVFTLSILGGTVGCTSDWRPGSRGFDTSRGRQQSFLEINHEIFSTVILSHLLIQEGQLSVSGERMCTILVNHLVD